MKHRIIDYYVVRAAAWSMLTLFLTLMLASVAEQRGRGCVEFHSVPGWELERYLPASWGDWLEEQAMEDGCVGILTDDEDFRSFLTALLVVLVVKFFVVIQMESIKTNRWPAWMRKPLFPGLESRHPRLHGWLNGGGRKPPGRFASWWIDMQLTPPIFLRPMTWLYLAVLGVGVWHVYAVGHWWASLLFHLGGIIIVALCFLTGIWAEDVYRWALKLEEDNEEKAE